MVATEYTQEIDDQLQHRKREQNNDRDYDEWSDPAKVQNV